MPRGYGKTQTLIKYIYDEYLENGQKAFVITGKKELSPTMNKVSDISYWDWYPTDPIIEPRYVDLKSTIEHFYDLYSVNMNMYDVFLDFKSFDAKSLWIKESWKWRVRAEVCEGKYCTLTAKERIDDAIKTIKKFTNYYEYYKTHMSTIKKELLTTWQEKRKDV